MAKITVDFGKITGTIKPMHAVNNGPSCQLKNHTGGFGGGIKTMDNLEEYRDAGIPYARTHDSSFHPRYGAEHTVDIHAIFPDFDADPTLPESYDFTCTDHYMDMIEAANTKVFYRLGSRIEHEVKKYGTLPPKDFHKWAVICEHIIRHYTEGWADGSHRDIQYWEIWNEPDLDPDDSSNKRTWGGTKAEFFDLYEIAAKHLKKCFPHLKIGGPAVAGVGEWAEDFLTEMARRHVPLDFFSWHIYAHEIEPIVLRAKKTRELLDKNGYTEAESILNEWNYVLDWKGDDIIYSHLVKKEIKGASFNIAAMCACQEAGVDMLMYYDARPTAWNGLFEFLQLGRNTTRAYYSIPMFNTLYRLGSEVASESDNPDTYCCAARNGKDAALLFTHYNDDDKNEGDTICVELCGMAENGIEAEFYVLDEKRDLSLTQRLVTYGDRLVFEAAVPNFTCYLIKLKQL